jgi:hypothetical protein
MTLEELKKELHVVMFAVDNGTRSLERAVEIVFSLIEDTVATPFEEQLLIDYVCEQMRNSHWGCAKALTTMIHSERVV